MKGLLNVVDDAIKRLVSPTTMLIAAVVISKGLDNPDSNALVIKAFMALLSFFAFVYLACSTAVTIKELDELDFNKLFTAAISISFVLLYMAMFIVAFSLGLNKIA